MAGGATGGPHCFQASTPSREGGPTVPQTASCGSCGGTGPEGSSKHPDNAPLPSPTSQARELRESGSNGTACHRARHLGAAGRGSPGVRCSLSCHMDGDYILAEGPSQRVRGRAEAEAVPPAPTGRARMQSVRGSQPRGSGWHLPSLSWLSDDRGSSRITGFLGRGADGRACPGLSPWQQRSRARRPARSQRGCRSSPPRRQVSSRALRPLRNRHTHRDWPRGWRPAPKLTEGSEQGCVTQEDRRWCWESCPTPGGETPGTGWAHTVGVKTGLWKGSVPLVPPCLNTGRARLGWQQLRSTISQQDERPV